MPPLILSDLVPPSPPVDLPTFTGPPLTPQQQLHFYSSDEWEAFIREWVGGLAESYVQVKRLGGSGDRGVDVAAFKTDQGLEGAWDCFQGKHYAEPLAPSDAYPEILKVFLGVLDDYYQMPDSYFFFAPKACGTTLNRLLSKPTELRQKFIEQLSKDKGCAAALSSDLRDRVRELAKTTDFSLFKSVELLDALETHRGTAYYASRFGAPLPGRPAVDPPPDQISEDETRYVAQLLEVYTEQAPHEQFDHDKLAGHPGYGDHFKRQRFAFYSAEALRVYARDSVPDGTFEALQDDMRSGVIEVAELSHPSGMDRLAKVLTTAIQVQLDRHAALLGRSGPDDRKGICHQLANDDRLTWVRRSDG